MKVVDIVRSVYVRKHLLQVHGSIEVIVKFEVGKIAHLFLEALKTAHCNRGHQTIIFLAMINIIRGYRCPIKKLQQDQITIPKECA